MVDIISKMDPQLYRKYVQNKGKRTVMHVDLNKALYGTLHAALLLRKNLTSSLEE